MKLAYSNFAILAVAMCFAHSTAFAQTSEESIPIPDSLTQVDSPAIATTVVAPPVQAFNDVYQVVEGAQATQFQSALKALDDGFNEVCGDTFCEGDFSNIQSLGVTCSMNTATQQLVQCTWAFAGAAPQVNPETGIIDTSYQMMKACRIDVKNVPLQDFMDTINGVTRRIDANGMPAIGIDAMFVGKSHSIYDQLVDCI
jgi:hypothetical protein